MRPVVETASGRVSGLVEHGVNVFRGVRYGAPTGGERRFLAACPPEPWTAVEDAHAHGPACPPTLTDVDRSFFPTSELWQAYAGVQQAAGFSEDCLWLSIWTEGLEGRSRPVVVWLHGGGFSWGSAASPLTEAHGLAAAGVVVVAVNHRLGILGALHLEDVAGPEWEGSGVAGLLDIRLALEWVRDNVAGFGGDPANVTLAGHSGGAAKVACMLALPSAQGLFRRAIMQSGPVLVRSVDADEANVAAADVLARTGLDAHTAGRLRDLAAETLTRVAPDRRFRPVVEGRLLPSHPFDPVAPPSAADVELLIGTAADDTATFKFDSDPRIAGLDRRGLVDRIAHHPAARFGDGAEAVVDAFARRLPDASDAELLVAITSATLREDTDTVLRRKLAGGPAPAWEYLFDYETPVPPGALLSGRRAAWHGAELPFVFGAAERSPYAGDRPERGDVARHMTACWASFARDGDPAGGGTWRRVDLDTRPTMVFDAATRLERDPCSAERLLVRRLRGQSEGGDA